VADYLTTNTGCRPVKSEPLTTFSQHDFLQNTIQLNYHTLILNTVYTVRFHFTFNLDKIAKKIP
jgi:hypothetical protein